MNDFVRMMMAAKAQASEDFTTVIGAPPQAASGPAPPACEPPTRADDSPSAVDSVARDPAGGAGSRRGSGNAPTAGIDRDATDLPPGEPGSKTRVDTAVRRRHTTLAELDRADRDRRSRDETRATWLRTATAFAIAATVLGGGWLLLRPPTADSLYARIKAVSNDDDGDLRDAADLIGRFLRDHADDPRAGEVAGLERTIALDRLERRARRKVRADRALSAIERDYRAAMAREAESPSDCIDALEALLALHPAARPSGPTPRPEGAHPEDDAGLWIDLVHRQIARLTPLAIDERQEDDRRIRAILTRAEALLTTARTSAADRGATLAEHRRLLESVVETYAGRPHARVLVEEATALLAASDGTVPPTPTPAPGAEPR